MHRNFVKETDLANLNFDEDKLDISKLKNVSSNLSNLKSKVDKLDVHKLVAASVDASVDSKMCWYFYIGFTDFMLKDKSLLVYANLFSPNDFENNDKIILKYFQEDLNKLKCIVMFAINIENVQKK